MSNKASDKINQIIEQLINEGTKPTVRLIRTRADDTFSHTTINQILRVRKKTHYLSLQIELSQIVKLFKPEVTPESQVERSVFEAANTLSNNGRNPTNKTVRDFIGKYSFTDISPALKKWKLAVNKSGLDSSANKKEMMRLAEKINTHFLMLGLMTPKINNDTFERFLDSKIDEVEIGAYQIPNALRNKLLDLCETDVHEDFFSNARSDIGLLPDWILQKYNLSSTEVLDLLEDLDIYLDFFKVPRF